MGRLHFRLSFKLQRSHSHYIGDRLRSPLGRLAILYLCVPGGMFGVPLGGPGRIPRVHKPPRS
jgi:hypothetical protein